MAGIIPHPPQSLETALSALLVAALALPGARAAVRPVRDRDAAAQGAGPADFSGWHLPLPAGAWVISRGPCGSEAPHNHACGYYENDCGIDLVPLSGSMENVPVLAPQSAQVFFLGLREVAGLTLVLQHEDGRVSVFMHLAKVVVGLDQRVAQGQVVAYAGSTGSSGVSHLHFHVLANAVERECLRPEGLDEIDYLRVTATSRNRAWTDLILADPPPELPEWLPILSPTHASRGVLLPARLLLAPGAIVNLPLAVANGLVPAGGVWYAGSLLTPTRQTSDYTLFTAPLSAQQASGEFQRLLELRDAGPPSYSQAIKLRYSVRQPPQTSAGQGRLFIHPTFIGPASWSVVSRPRPLCWTAPASTGQAPLRFRVMVVGPVPADSGWITEKCWQPPSLDAGTYYWKVFVRDARGYMNQPTQRPFAFRVK